MDLEANEGSPKQGHCRDVAEKSTLWQQKSHGLSGDLELKLKSLSIQRMRVLLSALSLLHCPPILSSLHGNSPFLCYPGDAPPFGMPPFGKAEGCSSVMQPSSASTSTAPHHTQASAAALPFPTPQVASIKRITEPNDEREGITGIYQL